MKTSFVILILLTGISLSVCQKTIVHLTNITRTDILSIKDLTFCKNDSDCASPYTYCKSSIIDNEIIDNETGDIQYESKKTNHCAYMDFLCPEDKNANCYYIDDIYKYSYDEKFRPILDTCMKEQVEEGKCKTKKCESNDDCFSGSCYSNSCVTNTPIYKCEQNALISITEDYLFFCEKITNMKCSVDDECIGGKCEDGYCTKIKYDFEVTFWDLVLGTIMSAFEMLLQMLVILFVVYIIIIFVEYLKKKNQYKPILNK